MPFLVEPAVAGVLIRERTRDRGGPIDLQKQPAVDVGDLIIAASDVLDGPLLVGPAVVGVLVHDGSRGGGKIVNVQYFARVAVDDVVVSVPHHLGVSLPGRRRRVDVPLVVPGHLQGSPGHLDGKHHHAGHGEIIDGPAVPHIDEASLAAADDGHGPTDLGFIGLIPRGGDIAPGRPGAGQRGRVIIMVVVEGPARANGRDPEIIAAGLDHGVPLARKAVAGRSRENFADDRCVSGIQLEDGDVLVAVRTAKQVGGSVRVLVDVHVPAVDAHGLEMVLESVIPADGTAGSIGHFGHVIGVMVFVMHPHDILVGAGVVEDLGPFNGRPPPPKSVLEEELRIVLTKVQFFKSGEE